ncbi:hypothetical protein THII_0149 [Thioploca ingrica]|uniref:Uncharacterized protein n=1 Tax=Thioploca ingrica TaxID=40754 RepID=A0A090BU41_9GAMM|nr:hypothetical protein THII_0149 [Thioploca ingrica]
MTTNHFNRKIQFEGITIADKLNLSLTLLKNNSDNQVINAKGETRTLTGYPTGT